VYKGGGAEEEASVRMVVKKQQASDRAGLPFGGTIEHLGEVSSKGRSVFNIQTTCSELLNKQLCVVLLLCLPTTVEEGLFPRLADGRSLSCFDHDELLLLKFDSASSVRNRFLRLVFNNLRVQCTSSRE
jgi:hypothetical protein